MKQLRYLKPTTLKDAIDYLSRTDWVARPFTGGTDLMVRIQKGGLNLDAVIDLKSVSEISEEIVSNGDFIEIGARVILSDLIGNPLINSNFPALVDASSVVGSVQIRNRATLAGNVCNASPAADTVPVLIAYNAEVELHGPEGRRTVPLRMFITGPGKTDSKRGEIVSLFRLPVPPKPTGCAFGRMTRRKGVDLATVNMACLAEADGGISFVFGAAGPKPLIVRDESGMLGDHGLAEAEKDSLLLEIMKKTAPISDIRGSEEYRRAMFLIVGKRVLAEALRRRAGEDYNE